MKHIRKQFVISRIVHHVMGGHFGNEAAGGDSVLVAHKITNQVSVALLASHNEVFLALVGANHLGDVFETSKHIKALHIEIECHATNQVGGDDGFHRKRILRHFAGLLALRQHIMEQQGTRLVTIE